MYRLLGEGRLKEAIEFLESFKKLKLNNLKPVDAAALAEFDEKLRENDEMQSLLCNSSYSESGLTRKFAVFVLGQVRNVDGKHFADAVRRLMSAYVRRELTTEDAIDQLATMNMATRFKSEYETYAVSLIEAICACPSATALAALKCPTRVCEALGGFHRFASWIAIDKLKKKYEAAFESINQSPGTVLPVQKPQRTRSQKSKVDPVQEVTAIWGDEALAPEQSEQKYNEWVHCRDAPGHGKYLVRLGSFIDDPRFSQETVSHLISWMQENPEDIDCAFRFLIRKASVVAELGHDLAQLTATGLWQMKSAECKKTVYRLLALVEWKLCGPRKAASLIEQAFTIEEPAVWRAAAEAIIYLRELDCKIELTTTARIQEIIDRDPVKYGKFLSPLIAGKLKMGK